MFKYFIPIGWYCGTAASLSKYGLRSFSGPFDWFFSDLEGVVYFLENDFGDFLNKGNLRVVEGKPTEFKDIAHGFHYNHDVANNFEEEYEGICTKYARRIKAFRNAAKQGVCFVRAVRDQEELNYIAEEEEHIKRVVKTYNDDNEIIYLIPQYLEIPANLKSKYFALRFSCYQGKLPGALRMLFDNNEELIAFLTEHCDKDLQKDNLIFDLRAELAKAEKESSVVKIERMGIESIENAYREVRTNEIKCKLLLKMARLDFSKLDLPSRVAIYGADEVGELLYDKIKGYCTVECFIDTECKEASYDGIPIVKPDTYVAEEGTQVIFIPAYSSSDLDGAVRNARPTYAAFGDRIVMLEDLLGQEV